MGRPRKSDGARWVPITIHVTEEVQGMLKLAAAVQDVPYGRIVDHLVRESYGVMATAMQRAAATHNGGLDLQGQLARVQRHEPLKKISSDDLKAELQSLGISQARLAREFGEDVIGPRAVSEWISKRHRIPEERQAQLIEILARLRQQLNNR